MHDGESCVVPKYLVCVLALGYWWCLVVRRARARVYTFKLRAMAADWTVTEVQSTYCSRRSKVEGPKGVEGSKLVEGRDPETKQGSDDLNVYS